MEMVFGRRNVNPYVWMVLDRIKMLELHYIAIVIGLKCAKWSSRIDKRYVIQKHLYSLHQSKFQSKWNRWQRHTMIKTSFCRVKWNQLN